MDIISASSITASALTAERMRLDIVGENIANANTTQGPDGKAYQRKTVAFETALDPFTKNSQGVRIGSISPDETPGAIISDPSHPHADANGMVSMPNVNIAFEMVDLIAASRSYEANLAVIRNSRQMATQALNIGR